MNIEDVLSFCVTATEQQKLLIANILNPATSRHQRNANSLAALSEGSAVEFSHDSVAYTGKVDQINRTTATVTITGILGSPRRSISVGSKVRVGATMLKAA